MSGFRVVLDTCVLVPIVKADLLLTLAGRQAFHPLWSNAILGELSRAIVIANPAMTEERATARIADMNAAFEDALIEGWEPIEDCVSGMPDFDDRHVVAAAVRGNAAAIVTDNTKHFPDEALRAWGLHAVSSDDFLLDLLDLNPSGMLGCLIEMSGRRRNPPITVDDLIAALGRATVPKFARELRSILDDS
ncbi:PIN domain-containing protein [Mycolicibacter sp. MYC123]|uniref:PIN domain-containing protein n=1 Tax=[Mycobacterium] zoologicum TaxID=2872311 RepID=A0ABU5YEF4_9MYCO|nr:MULTISPECIES: PIN domain-containing protein [unclassified Mycolicibacter]MEB3048422.1 PIN domain-containing protein [Mycolicibacter sp. MYC123]MEB3063871.1 PIN domain-containing protein [Mycolicibacter sp. MYC101]